MARWQGTDLDALAPLAGLTAAEANITALLARINDGLLRDRTTVQQELVSSVDGTGIQPYDDAGAFLTIPANTLQADDLVVIHAHQRCTGATGAGNATPYLWWGGSAGVQLIQTQGVALATTDHFYNQAYVHIKTAGGAPVWDSTSLWRSTVNQGNFAPIFNLAAQATQPTNASIVVQSGMDMTTSNANNKFKLMWLAYQILRKGS